MSKLPLTSAELIDYLDELIPEPSPRPGQGHDHVMYDAGRRSVVLQLRQLRDGDVPAPLKQKRGQGRVRS